MNKRILIIEDDASIAEIERDFLEIEGFKAVICADGAQGLKMAISEEFDLVLLDLMLPSMDGFEICRRIREHSSVPILMVTARIEDTDKIRGLGLGADDYISKPFSPTELVARVKANIAQYERVKSRVEGLQNPDDKLGVLQLGAIKVNQKTRRVFVDQEEIPFKNKEYELLVFLMSHPDIVFSKEHLYERIWGMDVYGDVKTVVVHINRLREKIEVDPQNPKVIQTVWGAGYRFSAV